MVGILFLHFICVCIYIYDSMSVPHACSSSKMPGGQSTSLGTIVEDGMGHHAGAVK